MDESWRTRMGVPVGRRPSENKPPELEPEDFDDVFGGPPKSVLARKLSADFTNAGEWFYQEIFWQPESPVPASLAGRRLPEFVIPERTRLSWSKCKGKCMLKSRSTSWSAQSFEDQLGDLSSYFPVGANQDRGHEDVALSSFTSKLRPINIPNRWSSSSTITKQKKQELPPFGSTKTSTSYMNTHGNACNNYMLESFNPGFPHKVASFETADVGPTSIGIPAMYEYDMQHLESPSSAVSSVSQAKMTGFGHDEIINMNSWAPEVNESEEIDICEAIAWAKEKFQGWSLDHEASHTRDC